ncbi:hypothetical protein BpHYR1_011208 [Brachionus plicatilis]|uniref:Uncharacterized protein n=1 Tax=Brachionus plicatilis TaxID=10195 RepID=A0A3M7SNJ9_BRAPC|nr:hypothetical protein BpHYR1_011208 [Brachionus plicatilis]
MKLSHLNLEKKNLFSLVNQMSLERKLKIPLTFYLIMQLEFRLHDVDNMNRSLDCELNGGRKNQLYVTYSHINAAKKSTETEWHLIVVVVAISNLELLSRIQIDLSNLI